MGIYTRLEIYTRFFNKQKRIVIFNSSLPKLPTKKYSSNPGLLN